MVYPEFHSNVTNISWARGTWRPRVSEIVWLGRCPDYPCSHWHYLSWASVRKKVKLYELLCLTLVSEHRFLGSEASIWPRLTASNAVKCHIGNIAESMMHQTYVMRTWDVLSFEDNFTRHMKMAYPEFHSNGIENTINPPEIKNNDVETGQHAWGFHIVSRMTRDNIWLHEIQLNVISRSRNPQDV